MASTAHPSSGTGRFPAGTVFLAFLRLGLTSFGGPVAHVGYFREEFVARRAWLDDRAYTDVVSLCQFLPGPASSQVAIALGLGRAGFAGSIAAWLGFTLPSALLLLAFGDLLTWHGGSFQGSWLHGLKVVAAAVVARALWSMSKNLCPDRTRKSIAVLVALAALLRSDALTQITLIVVGGLVGWRFLVAEAPGAEGGVTPRLSRFAGAALLILFATLLIGSGVLAGRSDGYVIQLFDGFYRAGAMVFGGGHVVLPLLRSVVVPPGWVSDGQFLAGYGAAQALPGPLFTFAGYLGAVSSQAPAGWVGGAIALLAIFLPGYLLVVGVSPFWTSLSRYGAMRRAMLGVNAAVVGLLAAAFYDPVWTSAIGSNADFGLALVCLLLLSVWKSPPWLVVLFAALAAGAGWG